MIALTSTFAIDVMRSAVQVALLAAAPFLIASLAIGVLVGLVQAVTQIQEQTLTFVPKLVGVALVFVIVLPWMLARLVEYVVTVIRSLPAVAS